MSNIYKEFTLTRDQETSHDAQGPGLKWTRSHFSLIENLKPVSIELDPTQRSCPQCDQIISIAQNECPVCGVVVTKLECPNGFEGRVSEELFKKWKLVLEHYDDLRFHDDFLNLSIRQQNLGYAAQKYQYAQGLESGDLIAKSMIEKIKIAAQAQITSLTQLNLSFRLQYLSATASEPIDRRPSSVEAAYRRLKNLVFISIGVFLVLTLLV